MFLPVLQVHETTRGQWGGAVHTHTHTELQKKNQADEIIMHAHKHAQATFVSGIGGQLGVRVVFETSFGFRRLKGL